MNATVESTTSLDTINLFLLVVVACTGRLAYSSGEMVFFVVRMMRCRLFSYHLLDTLTSVTNSLEDTLTSVDDPTLITKLQPLHHPTRLHETEMEACLCVGRMNDIIFP